MYALAPLQSSGELSGLRLSRKSTISAPPVGSAHPSKALYGVCLENVEISPERWYQVWPLGDKCQFIASAQDGSCITPRALEARPGSYHLVVMLSGSTPSPGRDLQMLLGECPQVPGEGGTSLMSSDEMNPTLPSSALNKFP